jgi:hypothetical protein
MSCSLGDESCYPINAAGELAREMGLEKGAGVNCGRGGFGRLLFAGIRLIRGFVWNGRGLPLLVRMDAPRGAELYQSHSEMRLSEVLL